MGYFTDTYGDELITFGLGYTYGTPHGRRMVHELAKAQLVYRTEQVKIISRFAAKEAGIRAGAFRKAGTSLALGSMRGAMRVAKHPAALVAAGGYVAGSAVGNTVVVQKRGDPNPLLMGVF